MITESEKIMFAIYELPWYDMSMRERKVILILLTRCSENIKMRIRGVFDLDFMHLRGVSE